MLHEILKPALDFSYLILRLWFLWVIIFVLAVWKIVDIIFFLMQHIKWS